MTSKFKDIISELDLTNLYAAFKELEVSVSTDEPTVVLFEALQALQTNKCILINFNKSVLIEDAKTWYEAKKKDSKVSVINIAANPKVITDALIEAANGKGEYANDTIVIATDGRCKIPKQVFNIKLTDVEAGVKRKELQDFIDYGAVIDELEPFFNKELNFDMLSAYRKQKLLGDIQASMEKVMIDYFTGLEEKAIAKEDAKLKVAEQKRMHTFNHRKIYNTASGQFESYTMKREPDKTSFYFEKEIQRSAISELLRAIIKQYDLGYVMTRNLVKHYTFNTILQVNFQDDFSQSKDFKHLYLTPDGKLYVHTKCMEVEEDEELERNSKVYKSYRCLTTYGTIEILPEGTLTFINVAHGASGVRKNASFYLLDDGKIESILERASRGIYGCHTGNMVNNSDIVKINTRIMASAAPSQILYNIDAFAIYVDKFGIGDKDSLIDDFKGLKKTLDGTAYTLFNAMQARLGSSKIFASQITKRLMQMMIHFLDAHPIVLEVGEEETEEQKAIMAAAFSKDNQTVMINGELVDLAGRIIICKKAGIGSATPEYFTDLNGFKANFDITKGFEIPVLDTPIANNAHSSTQFLSKVIAAGGCKAVDLITRRMKAYFDELLDNFTTATEICIKDLKDPFIKGLIGKACPEYMKLDIAVTRQTAGLLLNSMSKSLNRMRFPIIKSANGRAIPDIGALFGLPILKDDEVFTVDIKTDTDMIIIKYPTIGEKEFWKSTRVSYKTICNRINALEIPESLKGFGNDFKTELKTYFRNMEPGCVVMPADKAIMHGLAGMDYDYDMVIMIYDKAFVAIFKDVKPGVIHIMNDAEDSSALKAFNYKVMSDPQLELIAKAAANVGGVTNNYNIPIQFDLLCRYFEETINVLYVECLEAQVDGDIERAQKLACEISKHAQFTETFITKFGMLIDYSLLNADAATDILKKREKTFMKDYDFTGKAPSIKSIQKELEPLSNRRNGPVYQPIGENYDDPMYVYLPVSKAQKENAEKQLRTCRISTFTDIRMICADINRIARNDQETTIDSAKTSIVAKIVLNFSMFFNVFSKVEYDYEICRENNRIIRHVKRPNGDYGDLAKKYYIYDVFAIIRDQVEAYIIPKVQNIIDTYRYSEEEITNILPSYENTQNLAACIETANLYGCLAYYNANCPTNSPTKINKADLTNYYKAMHHMVKFAVKDTIINKSSNSFGRFAAWLSCYGNGSSGKIEKKIAKTGFNIACFPIETLYFAYKLANKLTRVCEPVTCIENAIEEGSMLEFVNGNAYNADGRLIVVAKEFLNGDFKMSKVDGKFMACDKVSNYVNREAYDRSYVAFSIKGEHKDLTGNITFDAAQRGAYSSRGNAKVVINGNIYDSYMYEALKVIKSMGMTLSVAHSFAISEDTTVVLAKVGDAALVVEDDVTAAYVPDSDFDYTDEEKAEIMGFNPNDYGFEYSDYSTPDFDNAEPVEFEF